MSLVRSFPYQEEIKIVYFEVFGEVEIEDWADDYEEIKKDDKVIESAVEYINIAINEGKMSLQEAVLSFKNVLIEKKNKYVEPI